MRPSRFPLWHGPASPYLGFRHVHRQCVETCANKGPQEEPGMTSDPFSNDNWDRSRSGTAAPRSAAATSWDWDSADPLSDSGSPGASRDPQHRRASRVGFIAAAVCAAVSVIAGVRSASPDAGRTLNLVCFVVALGAYGATWIRYTAKRVQSHRRGGRHRLPVWIALRLIAVAGAVWSAWSLAQGLAL